MSKLLVYSILISLVQSCGYSKENLLPSEYIGWIDNEDNNLTKSRKFNDLSYILKYRTIDYVISNEFKTNNIIKSKYDKRYKELQGMYYFSLRLKLDNKGESDVVAYNLNSQEEYFNRVNYYSYDFKNDIYMVENNDTLEVGLFNFVRTHGVAPYVDFVFAFVRKDQNSKDLQIVIDDKVFNTGNLKFIFEKESILKAPNLILK